MPRWTLDLRRVRSLFLGRYEKTLSNFPVIRQPKDRICWATCYKMVDNWRNVDPVAGWCHYARCSLAKSPSCEMPGDCCNQPRLTTSVLNDWKALGYGKVDYRGGSYTLGEVRQAIQDGHPIMAFLRLPSQRIGHFVLIVGTGRSSENLDNTYILADPMKEAVTQVGVTDMPYKGLWTESWRIEC